MIKDILTEIIRVISLSDNPNTLISLTANGKSISISISEPEENCTGELEILLVNLLSPAVIAGEVIRYELKNIGKLQLLTVECS